MSPDQVLTAAQDALRRDLSATGVLCPAAEKALAAAIEHRRWWLSAWADGVDHVPGLIAQDVQESLHTNVDPDWPTCPEHHDHALFVEPDLGPDPFWVCHRTGLPVASVGGL